MYRITINGRDIIMKVDEEFMKTLDDHKNKISIIEQKIRDAKEQLKKYKLERIEEINICLSLIDLIEEDYER